MTKWLEVVEEAEGDIWGSEIRVRIDEIKDVKRELQIYKVALKYMKRKYKIKENGVEVRESLEERITKLERKLTGQGGKRI